MRRSPLVAILLALGALVPVACGKYGPPHRVGVTASPAGLPASPAPPPYFGTEGTGILNPTSEPLPVPTAPPEEPEEETAP